MTRGRKGQCSHCSRTGCSGSWEAVQRTPGSRSHRGSLHDLADSSRLDCQRRLVCMMCCVRGEEGRGGERRGEEGGGGERRGEEGGGGERRGEEGGGGGRRGEEGGGGGRRGEEGGGGERRGEEERRGRIREIYTCTSLVLFSPSFFFSIPLSLPPSLLTTTHFRAVTMLQGQGRQRREALGSAS